MAGLCATATKRVEDERKRLSTEEAGIQRSIGKWESVQEDVQSYTQVRYALNNSTAETRLLDDRIEESNQKQTAIREKDRGPLRRLESRYVSVLREVFGDDADGVITIDGKGLRPVPDDRLAPHGAALSIMTTVLVFDLACMAASVGGMGYHPRWLIHDSPREGDMEEQLFHCLLEVVRDFESLWQQQEPSFQYIVTTTTPPPADLADENGPYVCLTLDARSDAGRLLLAKF